MSEFTPGEVLNDRYRLDEELGRGGTGTVFRAHDPELNRDVAVKILSNLGLGTDGRAQLQQEAQAIARLNHPNIVAVYDVGEVDDVPFIVMEYVEGWDVHRRAPDDLSRIVSVARQVAVALQHAHESGVIHRDLKPENVLLQSDGTAKLVDFGIARSVASRMTSEGQIAGTVYYLAPELALGQDFDGRADLYSLGVMLYELTTGELPFAQGDPLAVISQHIHATVVPPRAKNEEVPPRLDNLILQLMEKSPENRPASALEVQKMLERGDLLDPNAEGVKEIAVVRRIARGRFVGREEELTDATNLWNKALAGEGQLLLISGEPGIGKTRLIRELSTHVEVTGGRSLVGECESEGGAPYSPFAQIVRKSLRQGAENGFKVPEFVLSDLLELAPELKPYYPDIPPNPKLEPEAEQQRLFENVVAFCQTMSEHAPLMLVIDDAHWADSGSLSLLRYLAGRTQRQQILLAATYREVELDEARPFHEALLELNRKRLGTRLKLRRFDEQQTQDLLAAVFEEEITPEFLEGIFGETEGNPFFIEEVCKALVESGQVFHTENGWDRVSMDEIEIPQSVRVAIQSRVSKFPEEYQDTLNLAAILGREFDFDTLEEASDLDEDTLIDALETAEDAQLIEEVSGKGGATFSFVHALIPSTLAEGVRTLRRRRLHKRAAAAIEVTRPDDFEDLAHHYEESGDEEQARNYYTKAAERASSAYANQEAEDHYRAALDLEPSDEDRADLLAQLADVIGRLGRLEEAISVRQEAADLYEVHKNPERIAWCYTRMARDQWHAGDMAGALELSKRGLQLTEGAPESAELAGLIHETARAHLFLGSSDEALSLCNQALEMARRVSDKQVEADALTTMGILPNMTTEEAISALEEAIEIAQRERLLSEESRAHNNLAVMLLIDNADFHSGREHYLKAAEIAREMGDLNGELFAYTNAISDTISLGDLSEAEDMLSHGRELYEQHVDPGAAGENYLGAVSYHQFEKGQLEQAASGRRTLLEEAMESGSAFDLVGHEFFLGLILNELAEYEEAAAVLSKAIISADEVDWIRDGTRAVLAIVLARQGLVERARNLLEEAQAIHSERPRAFPALILGIGQANVLAAEGRWDDAFETFKETDAKLAEAGIRTSRATALRDWAEAHLARGEPGDTEQAKELLGEALTEYEEMGAIGWIERVQARLAELESKG
ncbi:MAG: serine/threonine-protein kinase PknK [Anaerolineales bacterium]